MKLTIDGKEFTGQKNPPPRICKAIEILKNAPTGKGYSIRGLENAIGCKLGSLNCDLFRTLAKEYTIRVNKRVAYFGNPTTIELIRGRLNESRKV